MIWTSEDAREIDRLSSEIYKVPKLHMMEEAGQAIFRLALTLWKPDVSFLILAGAGNNGGDSLVAARCLINEGFSVRVVDASEGRETPERLIQRESLEKTGCPVFTLKDWALDEDKAGYIIIDGLVGIGLKGSLREGLVTEVLRYASRLSARAVIAIDLPSGLDADCFDQPPPILRASHTITFEALKPLHVVDPSRAYCGKISTVKAIGFSPLAVKSVTSAQPVTLIHQTHGFSFKALWSFLAPTAHKYDRGHVLALGGSAGKVGAILHAAAGAWRAGAGWVSVAPLSKVMAPAWPADFTYEDFGLGGIQVDALLDFIKKRRVKAVLIGPGTVENPLDSKLLARLSAYQKATQLRLIFDAGALDGFLSLAQGIDFLPEHTLLTPHPGEWKKLSPELSNIQSMNDIVARPVQLRGFSIIYKSSTPIVLGNGRAYFITAGDHRLARAGSGDSLAGIILGLAATPRPIDEIAAIAQILMAELHVHGRIE
jgi:hydroxyethylthiazole kinase-like uncharacterized protein yjeF